MGTGARLGRALGAGLATFGRAETEREIREEEKRRFDEQSARKERQLKIQEQDAKQRKEMQELKIQQEKAIFNNKQLMQAYVAAKGDPQALGAAMSQYGNTGRVYQYNPMKSKEQGKIVYDIGTRIRTADGGLKQKDGKPEIEPLPLSAGEVAFDDQAALDKHIIKSADPEFLLAMERQKNKEEILRDSAIKLMVEKLAVSDEHRAKVEATPEGQRFIEKHRQEIENMKARTAKTKAETQRIKSDKGKGLASQAPVTQIKGIGGKPEQLTDADKQIAIQNQKAFEGQGYQGITVQEAYRMSQLQSDEEAQRDIADGLVMVQTGELTPAEFRDLAEDYNVPVQFFDNMLAEAEALGEIEREEAEARKPSLLKEALKLLQKVTNPGKVVSDKVLERSKK